MLERAKNPPGCWQVSGRGSSNGKRHRSALNTDEHHYGSPVDEVIKALNRSYRSPHLSGDGGFTLRCSPLVPLQILTQEDWNAVLYNGMASTTPLAALYFVALMTFGNYVLFNLLVAILVEGFQAEVRPKRRSSVCLFCVSEPLRQAGRATAGSELIELCCADDTKSCLQENNLHRPACVVSPPTFFLSRSAPRIHLHCPLTFLFPTHPPHPPSVFSRKHASSPSNGARTHRHMQNSLGCGCV